MCKVIVLLRTLALNETVILYTCHISVFRTPEIARNWNSSHAVNGVAVIFHCHYRVSACLSHKGKIKEKRKMPGKTSQ